jgi:hypothetical protein
MIRWLLVIPFALLFAISAGSLFLLVASVVDPVMAALTGNTLFVAFWSLMDALSAVDDPTPVVEGAATGLGRLLFTFLILPPAFVALVGEVAGTRRLVWYGGATGVLTAMIPWLLRGSPRVGSSAELHVAVVLGLTGAVAGLVYWMTAGRSAGDVRAPGATAPRPRGS